MIPRRPLALVAALALTAAAAPSTATAKTTITMSGSTSVTPLATKLAKAYIKRNKGKVGFKIAQGGSDIGINDAAKGRVSIGNASRDPQSADPAGLTFTKIARDGICVITNSANPINDLSQQQIQSIFAGRVRSWGDIPGARVSGAIDLVTRTSASGTADAFRNIFMGPNLNIAANAAAKQSNGLVQQTVRSNKNAIGFVSLDFLQGNNAVGYRGVPCTLRNAKSGAYQGTRNFWFVTRGKATGEAARFIRFAKSSAARSIVGSQWIPLS